MKTHIATIAAALLVGASSANAQAFATFGSAEVAGYGEGSVLIGTTVSTGNSGWGPIGTLIGQTYRYRNGIDSHAQAWPISPSVGLQYSAPVGAVQGSVGYAFVHTDETVLTPSVSAGSVFGNKNSPFVSAQANYWGLGEHTAQLIGSWATESEYYWTRFRAAQRVASGLTPVYLGGEVVLQGSQKTLTIVNPGGSTFTTPTQMRYQFGPTLEYRLTNSFRIGGAAGVRGGNNNYGKTGYARIEFLALSR